MWLCFAHPSKWSTEDAMTVCSTTMDDPISISLIVSTEGCLTVGRKLISKFSDSHTTSSKLLSEMSYQVAMGRHMAKGRWASGTAPTGGDAFTIRIPLHIINPTVPLPSVAAAGSVEMTRATRQFFVIRGPRPGSQPCLSFVVGGPEASIPARRRRLFVVPRTN